MYEPRQDEAVTFDDHTDADVEHVGSTTDGHEMFFDAGTRTLFRGEYDGTSGTVSDTPESHRELEPRETLGEALESLGDDLEWDSLSAFAREHVQSDED